MSAQPWLRAVREDRAQHDLFLRQTDVRRVDEGVRRADESHLSHVARVQRVCIYLYGVPCAGVWADSGRVLDERREGKGDGVVERCHRRHDGEALEGLVWV